ncbi:GRAM domain-containing protein 2A-like isoform X2 [Thalassophryne amazonica]|uniref:GRAM domain-containing protein 2A-like isoform X2 n=1 Tax=Thalassophryne amazonica TaxID=390379 RepID=UPI00147219E4|nr:GRAM domain-containing protein 2A-like isoform X2 [Thalassophryne amazonica]
MSLKSRKFALDSCLPPDGAGSLGVGKASRKISKKAKELGTLEEPQVDMEELNQSLNSTASVREQTAPEGNAERPDGIITRNSFIKHNRTFHKLFQEIPDRENLTHMFTCALQKEVLYHGKLYMSNNYLCFYSSVLLKDTKVVISTSSVRKVKKHSLSLARLSIQTADGEKYSFDSLTNREMCYKCLHAVCSYAQGESGNTSPQISSAENEANQEAVWSSSSFEDSIDQGVMGESIYRNNSFPRLAHQVPIFSSIPQTMTDEEDNNISVSWTWGIAERVTPFFLRELWNLSVLFYIYVMLMVLLLLASGYIGLRIIALEEQLESLGVISELSSSPKEHAADPGPG